MRSLKAVLWVTVLFVVAVAIIGPATWLVTVNSLPNALESEADIEMHLRQSIESERQGVEMAKPARERLSVKWERPDFTKLPKNLIALNITEWECPTYFQTPREDGGAWLKRLLASLQRRALPGDGACELIFANRLASRLGCRTPLQLAVGSDRIHRFLQKDQLLAFDLHSMQFEQGIIGVEAASRYLMQKPLTELSLAELAEFQLAIPPWGDWDTVKVCQNAAMIREARDGMLQRLAAVGLVTEEMARSASAQPVRCLSVHR